MTTKTEKPVRVDADTYTYRGRRIVRRSGSTAVQFSGRIATGFSLNKGWRAELGSYVSLEEMRAGKRSDRRMENYRTIALAVAAIDADLDR